MDVLDLYAKISLDKSEYDKGLSDASAESSGFASKLAGGLGKAVSTVAKVGAAAVGAASTAVVAMTKQAVSSFADYEQLVGGVETLFGAGGRTIEEYAASIGKSVDEASGSYNKLIEAQEFVVDRAHAAFETAGLSANDYMETVTSFSAALISSVGGDTQEAAKIADQAIIDMSDNANKMGSSMESIQNAYQGFAKQNYTMLDNLKLGYGGTKEEMARLLSDAEKLSGQKFDLSSYADIVQAIHIVQESMDIAGTTAREASTTITGSLNMTKAAWSNLLTAIGKGDMGGITTAIDNLVSSADTFGKNVMPVVQRSLAGIVQLIGTLAPEIAAVIPSLVSDILPTIIDAGIQIVGALGTALSENIGTLVFAAYDIIEMLFDAMLKATSGTGAGTIAEIIDWIIGAFQENYMQLIDVGIQIIMNLINGISSSLPSLIPLIVDVVVDIANHLIENVPLVIDAGIQLIMGLLDGFNEALPVLVEAIPEIITGLIDAIVEALPMVIDAIVTAIPLFIDGAMQLVTGIVGALPEIIQALIDALPTIIDAVIQGLLTALPMLIQGNVQLILALVAALPQIIQALIDAIPQIIMTIVESIIENAPLFLEAITSIVESIVELIVGTGGTFVSSVGGIMSNVISTAVQWLQQLPERVAYFAGQMVGQFILFITSLPQNIATTFTEIINALVTFGERFITEGPRIAKDFGRKLIDGFKSLPSKMIEVGKAIIDGLKTGVSNAWDSFTEWISSMIGDFIAGLIDAIRGGGDDDKNGGKGGGKGGINPNSLPSFGGITPMSVSSGIVEPTFASVPQTNDFSEMLALLREIRDNSNVTVVLEGDADRIFRVMQTKANSNYRLTGNTGLVTL